ncbi:putative protein disulfide-isomerase A6 [Tetrabaena socialis]|uniref:protein disulfide-isomerase n=1 Tax=Tetrabaena socialis TaxID=47790 RepID=A0A2J8AGB9_9CHLO|nr:putative protein disulfide-isomerase A6 [Tetrabaena socialis]|eukprot:PNH11560.1 putative protein disulfide-isomerase A6 [Tetrabaena socialis]
MKLVLAVALLGALALVSASDDPTISLAGVLDLTPESFEKNVNGAKHVLVEFYAPWCGHCKRMVPEYKQLGEWVEADPKLKNRVIIAKVNADNHRSIGDKFDVKGFPTIKYFPAGKPATKDTVQDYNQARTATAFLEFLKQKLEADQGFARVEALDPIAKKFVEAEDKAAVLAEATAALAALEEADAKANGALYIKFMEKAVEKGADYLGKEKARLDKMLSSGSVSSSKVDEMSRKTSVLGAFVDEE